jgi:hypothetical protein
MHTSTDSAQSRELSQKGSDDSVDGLAPRKQAHSTPAMVTRRLTALRKRGQSPNGFPLAGCHPPAATMLALIWLSERPFWTYCYLGLVSTRACAMANSDSIL